MKITFDRVHVTPKVAANWLKKMRSNRNPSQARIKTYAKAMTEGHWIENGETIKFDSDGNLIDGQHRLYAVIEANISIHLDVANNVPAEAFHTIDQQKVRGANDVLTIMGEKNTTALATASRWMCYLTGIKPRNQAVTNSEIVDAVSAYPALHNWVSFYKSHKQVGRLFPASISAVMTLSADIHGEEIVAEFAKQLSEGSNLKKGDPAYEIRERMISNKAATAKLGTLAVTAMFIKALNAFVMGKKIHVIRYSENESWPDII